MRPRCAMGILVALCCVSRALSAAETAGQGKPAAAQSGTTSISGTLATLDLDAMSPTILVSDGKGMGSVISWSPTGKSVAPAPAPRRGATSRPPAGAGTTDRTHGLGRGSMAGVNRYSTAVTAQNRSAALSDLKVGQQVQITGRYLSHVGRFVASAIAITQEPVPKPAPSSPTKGSASSTTPAVTPSALRSLEKAKQSGTAPPASPSTTDTPAR